MATEAEKWLAQVENLPESNLLAVEVQEAVEQACAEATDMDESEYWDEEAGNMQLRIRGIMENVSVVHNSGGYDDSPGRQVVIKVREQHFMKTGYYSSFDGTEWDSGLREVSPTPRTITEWL